MEEHDSDAYHASGTSPSRMVLISNRGSLSSYLVSASAVVSVNVTVTAIKTGYRTPLGAEGSGPVSALISAGAATGAAAGFSTTGATGC
ncbi:MAG: hypothetical protein NTV05_16365 [Acidobacteria bacterium]|nr:hypothetical protein [Acidobacteriota bacterium]